MTLVVGTTAGESNANSYVTVAEADTYVTTIGGNSNWTSTTTSEKEGALIYATVWLDSQYAWYGLISAPTQALGWPRIAFYDHEGRPITGIPQKVKNATIEMALQHISTGLNSAEEGNVKSEKIGDASITYTNGGSRNFSYVKLMLRDYGTIGYSKSSVTYRA